MTYPWFPRDLAVKLEQRSLRPGIRIRGTMQGKRRSGALGSSLEFADYRLYTPGDDIRQLDWNAYGRTGKPFVKLFLDEQELQIHLWLDASLSMTFGGGDGRPDKFDYARRLAACVGYMALCGYDRVGASVFGAGENERLPLLRGRGSVDRLLRFLDGVRPAGGENLDAMLADPGRIPRLPGMTWIFSDFLYETRVEKTLNALKSRGQQVVAVQVLSAEETEPRLAGDLKLLDSELGSGKEVAMSRPVLEAYRRELTTFTRSLEKMCHERGAAFVSVRNDRPLEEVVLRDFRQAGLIQ